jgi:hypothetical protein
MDTGILGVNLRNARNGEPASESGRYQKQKRGKLRQEPPLVSRRNFDQQQYTRFSGYCKLKIADMLTY